MVYILQQNILVVDDNFYFLETLSYILKRNLQLSTSGGMA